MAEGKIYASICKVMEELGAVGKTSKNQQQGFMYRGIDAVMNALSPVLARNHVFVVPEVIGTPIREERQSARGGNLIYSVATVKYTFYADDGSSVSAVVVGEGMDSGDKSMNKALAIAMKYVFFQVFCIPTEEMVDPDSECHEVKAKTIDLVKQKVVEKKVEEMGIPIENVYKAYKISSLSEMTVEQWTKLTGNWDAFKSWYDAKQKVAADGSKGQS